MRGQAGRKQALGMPPVISLLGPTNTGKTYLAVERMLEHSTGMIGFPLRLLARENYDRVVQARGRESVALVTGEERIVPPRPRYYVCTVEAMPVDVPVDFLAVDEVQLAADRERGHVFTDRLLHARGVAETMFLGAETIRPLLRRLVPRLEQVSRPRLSTLRYVAPRKLERIPRRSALIVFGLAELYAVAERLRSRAGGAALVFGALSPRARNAQVGLYQAGEVDHLVATDAIGMGLNLDLEHVAFTSLVKHDGVGPRQLRPAEVGQIAGRAGRHVRDGTFGATAELGAFAPLLVEAVEQHRFEPLKSVYWRNSRLSFASIPALVESLERRPPQPWLVRMRNADDQRALEGLARDPEIAGLAQRPDDVRLLWEVCQVPDFRNGMTEAHTRLLSRIYSLLVASESGLPWDWVDRQVRSLDATDGDIETLLENIAGIRTWTYVSHRPGWLADALGWQARTRQVEDRLSDALHERLREEFVSRGASVIARHDPGELVSRIGEDGTLELQGIPVGRLLGFRFEPLPGDSHTLRAAANRALREGIDARVGELCESGEDAFALTSEGAVLWRGSPVGRLLPADRLLAPQAEALGSDLLDPPRRERVRRRVTDWLAGHVRRVLAPLFTALAAPASGAVRGLVYTLAESLGGSPRRGLRATLSALTRSERQEAFSLGVVLGRRHVFLPSLLAPEALRVRATLWHVAHAGGALLPVGPPSLRRSDTPDPRRDAACGYEALGELLVRVDVVERLLGAAHQQARQGRLVPNHALARPVRCETDALPEILEALGFERGPDGFQPRPAGRGAPRRGSRDRGPVAH